MTPGAVFTTLHFLRNLQMDPLRYIVTWATKASQLQNTKAYLSIGKL